MQILSKLEQNNIWDRLTYSGVTDRPDELYYSFSISNDLTQIVNILTYMTDCWS